MQCNRIAVVGLLIGLCYTHPSFGKATYRTTKSEQCPHGETFMDRCESACACDSSTANLTLTICQQRGICESKAGSCPYGAMHKHEFLGTCLCNYNKYQTYECFEDMKKPFKGSVPVIPAI